jgi:hypothetical protein
MNRNILAFTMALSVCMGSFAIAETSLGLRGGTMLGFGVQLRHDFRDTTRPDAGFWGVRGTVDALIVGSVYSMSSIAIDVLHQRGRSATESNVYTGVSARVASIQQGIGSSSVVFVQAVIGVESPLYANSSLFLELYPITLGWLAESRTVWPVPFTPVFFSGGWTLRF